MAKQKKAADLRKGDKIKRGKDKLKIRDVKRSGGRTFIDAEGGGTREQFVADDGENV